MCIRDSVRLLNLSLMYNCTVSEASTSPIFSMYVSMTKLSFQSQLFVEKLGLEIENFE